MKCPEQLRTLALFVAAAIVAWFAALVATGYFVFLPARRRESLRYYSISFPEKSALQCLWLAFRQYQSFARVHAEHVLAKVPGGIRTTSLGYEYIQSAISEHGGGLLLMSHIGSPSIAGRELAKRGTALTMIKANRSSSQSEVIENEVPGLRVEVKTTDAAGLGIIELRDRLRAGGVVSLTGDRVWTKGSRQIVVSVLGHTARVAAAPFALALATGMPVLICFAVRKARRTYHCECFPPVLLKADSPRERLEVQQAAAQRYADILERYLRTYPEQWHTFERFLEEPADQNGLSVGNR